MKKLLLILLLIVINKISSKQVFIRTGTGLKDVNFQWKIPGMKTGCLFMAVCVIGGLGSDKEMIEAREWANKKGYASGTRCNINIQELAKKISIQFKTTFHKDWKVKYGCNHYWTVDGNGREVFNAAGLGYTHCKK